MRIRYYLSAFLHSYSPVDNPLGAAAYDNLNKLLEIEAGSILLQKVLSMVIYHFLIISIRVKLVSCAAKFSAS